MDNTIENLQGYLELSSEPIRFEPVSKVTNVFFDEANKEVLSVRGGGTLGVVVKDEHRTLTFCMDHKGTISSIKFSPDHGLLAIQRTPKAVEISVFTDGELRNFLVQECRTKSSNLLGFLWTSNEHIVLVSDHAVEFYQVMKEKNSIRFIKSYSQNANWFVWSPECHLLLLCIQISSTSTTLQPFSIVSGQIAKQQRFEVETSSGGSQGGLMLGERDVYIGTIYENITIGVLRHPATVSTSANLDIYSHSKDGIFTKSHICLLEMTGKFAVNVLDSLLVVHHQASKTSLVFDILLGVDVIQGVTNVYPITLPKSMMPFFLEESGGAAVPSSTHSIPSSAYSIPCELYAPTWVVFQPDVVIDARLGCLWRLQLQLSSIVIEVEDKVLLIDMLLRRKNAMTLVLTVVKDQIEKSALVSLGYIYDKINQSYRHHLNVVMQSQMGECVGGGSNVVVPSERVVVSVIVDQVDMYSKVFAPLMESLDLKDQDKKDDTTCIQGEVTWRLLVDVALQYIQSLDRAGITVQHFINELIINGLVRTKNFYQLHQLLQYHVLNDSKPLACLLLSLASVYPAGEQLSLDMLRRLNTAHDEIIEVLLSKKSVVQALKYAKNVGQAESLSARKFLEVAKSVEDPIIFFSTYNFFSLRNSALRGSSAFARGEHCDIYVDHYRTLFGEVGS